MILSVLLNEEHTRATRIILQKCFRMLECDNITFHGSQECLSIYRYRLRGGCPAAVAATAPRATLSFLLRGFARRRHYIAARRDADGVRDCVRRPAVQLLQEGQVAPTSL